MFSKFIGVTLLAVAVNAQQWTVQPNIQETIMMGMDFPSATTGFIYGSTSNGDATVQKTTDGGNSWQTCNGGKASPMPMTIAMGSTTSGIISGLGFVKTPVEYTTDGFNWQSSLTPEWMATTQDAEDGNVLGHYGLIGQFDTTDGVAFSKDGGMHFDVVPSNCMKTDVNSTSRYGAFPSGSTWYITCGAWPSSGAKEPASVDAPFRMSKFVTQFPDGRRQFDMSSARLANKHTHASKTDSAGSNWIGMIQKTINGGQTFDTVFISRKFYFNAIACPSVNVCYAACENDAGAFVYMTKDAGKTWTNALSVQNLSLITIKCLSLTECWVGGGFENIAMIGTAYHTTDGGSTWTQKKVNGVYFVDLSFPAPNQGFATAMDQAGGSLFLTYN